MTSQTIDARIFEDLDTIKASGSEFILVGSNGFEAQWQPFLVNVSIAVHFYILIQKLL
jgi:hypothetical protein